MYSLITASVSAALASTLLFGCTTQKRASAENGSVANAVSYKTASQAEFAFPLQGQKIDSPAFVGSAYFLPMIQNEATYNFPATNYITFEAGARRNWHTHGGMLVLAISGVGYYQEEGKKAQILRPGDVVQIPAGVRHWHGAAPDSAFSQIVIYDSHWTGAHDDGEIRHISAEEYAHLPREEFTGRVAKQDAGLLFARAAKSVRFPTFTGEAFVSNLADGKNAAGSPDLHYVVFEPGVITDWHSHEGGQILIATDGIGYHQIEGEPVQILRPGDVVRCPPGVRHWHGAGAGVRFAHIAANTNPDRSQVTWFGKVSEDAYKTIVPTEAGTVRGQKANGTYRFLGVPYAEAKERFVPPTSPEKWDGIRDASTYGPTSPQAAILGMGTNNAGEGTANDCLNLNIWTPSPDGKKRAVMVWLHGGGFSVGSANEATYDGANLARTQDVVVVGVNHRLNIFGHLDLSTFGEKYRYSANTGMLDIVAALRWIQNNIAAFGGDADNVTIFGESGGGAKVLAMMTAPEAKGLFHKAINESGATENMGVEFIPRALSAELGALVVKNLGLTQATIEQIQSVDALSLMNAGDKAHAEMAEKYKLPVSIGDGYAMEWEPVIDGDFLPTHPVLKDGFAPAGRDIPLLIGSNLNEWTTFMPSVAHGDMSGKARAEYEKAYPNEDSSTAPLVDTLLRLPLLKITAHKADQRGAPVYSYIFTKQIGTQGSYHGAEIPFVFANTDDPLASVVSEAWANFAKTGVPSAKKLPAWEAYTRKTGAVMILDDKSYLAHHHDEALLKLLAPDYIW